MKKIIVTGMIVLALCFAGCGGDGNSGNDAKPAKPNGNAGVSVNAVGALVINAPLYVVDSSGGGNPTLAPIAPSKSESVSAYINETIHPAATGTIYGGNLSITIPVPAEALLTPVIDNFFVPLTFVKSGGDVKVGALWLNTDSGSLRLISSPSSNKEYNFSYSQGDAVISGSNATMVLDITITQGWNSTLTDPGTVHEAISSNPTTSAKWVYFEEDD